MPRKAPTVSQLLQQVGEQGDFERIAHVLGAPSLPTGRYLHWDDLHHKEPPEGLTRDVWWLILKISRRASARELSLVGVDGLPFTFSVPSSVQKLLHRADKGVAGGLRLDEQFDVAGSGAKYRLTSMMEEAITSSQLEGAATTRRVAKKMLFEGRRPRDHDERMIWNNHHAMQMVQELADRRMTLETLLELHATVTRETLADPDDAGRFRVTDDVRVQDHSGNVLHRPPAFADLPDRMAKMLAFANGDGPKDGAFLHPVLRSVILHYWLAYDHPFVDGNGRTARALFYWSMLSNGYWLSEYLSVSRILKKAPSKYARSFLLTQTDGNDMTYFIVHQMEVIEQAVNALHQYLRRISRNTRGAARLARDIEGLNARQVALLQHAIRHSDVIYTFSTHEAYHHVTNVTARKDLIGLAERGLLVRRKTGRAVQFFVPANLAELLQG